MNVRDAKRRAHGIASVLIGNYVDGFDDWTVSEEEREAIDKQLLVLRDRHRRLSDKVARGRAAAKVPRGAQ